MLSLTQENHVTRFQRGAAQQLIQPRRLDSILFKVLAGGVNCRWRSARVNSGVGRLRLVIVEMRKPTLIYPESFNESRVPKSLRDDITNLFEKVGNWRASNEGNEELAHYKQIARALGFRSEGNFQSFGRKKADLCKLYETEELTYQAIIEIETSTIENGYNDILKMMQLIKSGDMDYGVIIFVQNNRGSRPKLTESQLHSNLVNGLGKVLDDFRGKLFMYHVNP